MEFAADDTEALLVGLADRGEVDQPSRDGPAARARTGVEGAQQLDIPIDGELAPQFAREVHAPAWLDVPHIA